ncbi:MAG: hypothetical protein ACFFA4_08650 [Promethearchaeota archaeon]
MNLTFQLLGFLFFIITGFFIFKWYLHKKGLEYDIKRIIIFIGVWKTIMLFILIWTDYMNDQIGKIDPFYHYEILFLPNILVIISFVINFLLGILLFEIIFKDLRHEVIIIIIVILEMIFNNCILFPLSNFL